MQWWTIQIGQWRKLNGTGITLVDISIKGNSLWGPDWDFLMAYKRGEITEAQYIELYRQKWERTVTTHPERWMELLTNQEPVALGCFCGTGKFCHRHLLTQYCIEACTSAKIPFRYHGEYRGASG